MRAVVLTEPDVLELEDRPGPDADGRALVAVDLVGLCGTDVKILNDQIPVDHPRVLGHEVVGRVVESGPRGLVGAGTRVLVNPSSWCGHCRHCQHDRTHVCTNGALMGRDVDGGFAEQLAVDEVQLIPIPDHLGDHEASVLQVLGTCVHAQRLVDVFPGQTAAVIGLGVAGLLHVQLLRERGVERIVGITRTPWKRQLAEEFGAAAVAHPDEAAGVVAEITGGAGIDLVLEAAGSPDALAQGVELAGIGGTLLAFGISASLTPDFPAYQLYFKELAFLSARAAAARDYARGVELAARGRLDLDRFWTGGFPLQEADDAFAALGDTEALKVTLEVS